MLWNYPLEDSAGAPALVGNADSHAKRQARAVHTRFDQRACKYKVAGSTHDLSLVGQPIWFYWSENGQSL